KLTVYPHGAEALLVLPTASCESRAAAKTECGPAGLVDTPKLPAVNPAATPEPPSSAAQFATTLGWLSSSGEFGQVRLRVGPFLSIWLPLIGPPVALLPTASATLREFVDALAVSSPAATLVERLKLASAALAR